MKTSLPAPTEQDLRAAWQRCRIAAWPATFEETMADPARSTIVRITASRAIREAMKPRRSLSVIADRVLPSPPMRSIPPRFDRKRAAAGDRDDD